MAQKWFASLELAKAAPDDAKFGKDKDGNKKEWTLFAYTGVDVEALVLRGIPAIPAKGADEKDDAFKARITAAIAALPRKTVYAYSGGEAVAGYPIARDVFSVEGGKAEKGSTSALVADANARAAAAEEARKAAEAQARLAAENLQRTIREMEEMKRAYAEAQARLAQGNGPQAKQTVGRK